METRDDSGGTAIPPESSRFVRGDGRGIVVALPIRVRRCRWCKRAMYALPGMVFYCVYCDCIPEPELT